MQLMRTLILAVLAALPGLAQMTVSAPTISLVSHGAAYAIWTLSANGYCSVLVGLTTGGPYTTIIQPAAQSSQIGTTCASNLSGLAPSTNYFAVATGRPNATNATGQVISSETPFTTLALPAIHPAYPAQPVKYRFVPPNVSSYTTIPMTTSGGFWVAASSVANPGGWNGSVTAGDSLRQIVECEAGPKAILDFPQGVSGTLPLRTSTTISTCQGVSANNVNVGMFLPDYGAPTDYMIFETHETNPQDFPPFGYRTDPIWYGSKMATIKIVPYGPPMGAMRDGNGQLFSCYAQNCSHVWMKNLHVTVDPTQNVPIVGGGTTTASGQGTGFLAPLPVNDLIQIQGTTGFAVGNIIIDRNWFDFPPPYRLTRAMLMGGVNNEVIGNYSDTGYWNIGRFPGNSNPAVGANTITYGTNMCWALHSSDPLACPASSGTITISGTITGAPGYFLTVTSTGHVNFYYDNSTGASATCSGTGCTATTNTSGFTQCVPLVVSGGYNCGNLQNEYLMSSGNFTGSAINVYNNPSDGMAAGWYNQAGLWATTWFQPSDGSNLSILNNLTNSVGQTLYADADVPMSNIDVEQNQWFGAWSKLSSSPVSNGLTYRSRQVIEMKQCNLCFFFGNVIDGGWGFQNGGQVFDLASSQVGTTEIVSDVTYANSIIRNYLDAFSCFAYSNQGQDGPPVNRVWYHNILLYNQSGFIANYSPIYSAINPVFQLAGCNDMRIDHITHAGQSLSTNAYLNAGVGIGPSPLLFDASWQATGGQATFNISEGFAFHNNLLTFSAANPGISFAPYVTSFTNQPASCLSIYPATGCVFPPLPNNQVSQSALFPALFVNIAATIAPSYNDSLNAIVMGQQNIGCCLGTVSDITGSTMATIAAGFDTGFNIIPGSTLAARNANVGFANPSTSNFTIPSATAYNSGIYGVNYNELYSGIGLVQNIGSLVSSSSAALTYLAPDTGICYVDLSSNGFATWTRYTDSGGYPVNRTLPMTGLGTSTTYGWRLSCRYRQANAYTNTNDYLVNQLSDGALVTLSTGTRNPSFTFSLSSFSGATSFKVILTAIGGTQYAGTCATSPCVLSNVPVGDYSIVQQWMTGSTVVASSDAQVVNVR